MKKFLLIVNTTVVYLLFLSIFFLSPANIVLSQTVTPISNPSHSSIVEELLKILLDLPIGNPGPPPPTVTLIPPISGYPTLPPITPPVGGYAYYPQCSGPYDNYPLPNGCNLCKAGCGPTTVAMIISSLVDSTFIPPRVVDYYKSNNYYLGCDGSRYSDAYNTLRSFGLQTTDYLVYSSQTIDQIAVDFHGYLNAGWTLFALANYCDGGCGHFFWITQIDANNFVWAYDPYYGRLEAPPINENRYYPFPRYRVAFGVRK